VIAVVCLDALSLPRTERLLAEGRMPALAALRERGTTRPIDETDGLELMPGSVFFTMPTGRRPARHGRFYPFVWNPAAQRVQPDLRPIEHSIWEAAARAGRRVVVIDPYEAGPPGELAGGAVMSGWQLHNRVTLRRLATPATAAAGLRRDLGPAPTIDEIYGRPSLRLLRRMNATLARAPERLATAVERLVRDVRPDLLWCHLVAAHVGGHVLWDGSQLAQGQSLEQGGLGDALDRLYELTDLALGRIAAAAGEDATLLVTCPLGMGPNPSRSDVLPGMVDAVLGDGPRSEETDPTGLWRLRSAVPTDLRALIARAIPDRLALRLASGLATSRPWPETAAFAMHAEPMGAVQLNLRGREREGCVDSADAPALIARLREGLCSFRDRPGGGPAVAAVREWREVVGEGSGAAKLPDLLVEWSPQPSTAVDAVVSPVHGVVRRPGGPGGATGRSANHIPGEAWMLAIPGAGAAEIGDASWRHADIAPTVAALLDVQLADVDGVARLRPA
jgi:hypothetical protein